MIEMDARYAPIEDKDETSSAGDETISIKVLQQETSGIVSGLTVTSTVADLKKAVQKIHKIPVLQQRLIFSGKPLAPDDKPLCSFNIKDESVVHLFPRPIPSASSAPGASTEARNPIVNRSYENVDLDPFGGSAHLPIHFDDQVGQSVREVKMWSYILVVVSAMTLFSNFSYMGATGKAGNGSFDSVVNIVETVCSVMGLYVGQLGLKATVTVDMPTIQRYLWGLCALAGVTICLRVAWVVDVVVLAKKELKESHEAADNDDTTSGDDNSIGGGSKDRDEYGDDDDYAETPHMSDRSFMVYFTVQAVIMASIIIAMWLTCVSRAFRFRRAVQSYEGISNTSRASHTT